MGNAPTSAILINENCYKIEICDGDSKFARLLGVFIGNFLLKMPKMVQI
jgi:hypothetical protein